MNRESGLHCLQTRPAQRPRAVVADPPVSAAPRRDDAHADLPVLIRVPRVAAVELVSRGAMPARRRRRRLRREFRAVGLGLLTCLPMTWLLAGAVGGRVDLTLPDAPAEVRSTATVDAMPVVLLSLEPLAGEAHPRDSSAGLAGRFAASRDQDDTPPSASIGPNESVQMPGYLLPIDGVSAEEEPHAGY
jgi:hypothetical protein